MMKVFGLVGGTNLRRNTFGLALAATLFSPLALSAQPPTQIPWQPGMAVATCRSSVNGINDPIVGIYDVRDPDCRAKDAKGASLKGKHWPLLGYFNKQAQSPSGLATDEWTRANLCDDPNTPDKETNCQVFGIALDSATPPNIWVTTTALYQDTLYNGGPPDPYVGVGQVIRLDGTTGKITHAISLSTNGKGLGNIAFDRSHQQFFVTDPGDGKLYRLTLASDQLHLAPAGPALSLVPVADAANPPLAVGVFQDRVYFSVWHPSSATPNAIYSVGLDASGDFDLVPPVKEIERASTATLQTAWPPLPGAAANYPVTDIEFSPEGRILFAERSQYSFKNPLAHQSRVFEAERAGTGWVATAHPGPHPKFQVGTPTDSLGGMSNAAGGVDYDCVTANECNLGGRHVMATGDFLLGSPLVYGFQVMSAAGGDATTSWNIDLDGVTNSTANKTEIGDVDVYHECGCLAVGQESVRCSPTKPGQFVYTFDLTNLSNLTGQEVYVVSETPGVDVSPHVISLGNHPIAPGKTAAGLQVTITGATSGQKVCLRLSLQTRTHRLCCAKVVCLTMPNCCLEFLPRQSFACVGNGLVQLNFKLRSFTPWGTSGHLFLDPTTPLDSNTGLPLVSPNPDYFPLNLSYGGTYVNSTNLSGSLPLGTQVCIDFTIHNPSLELCCSQSLCLTWPCK